MRADPGVEDRSRGFERSRPGVMVADAPLLILSVVDPALKRPLLLIILGPTLLAEAAMAEEASPVLARRDGVLGRFITPIQLQQYI